MNDYLADMVPEDFMAQVLTEDVLRKAGIKVKPEVKEEPKVEKVDESKTETKEDHVCPLCESKLENAISDEKLLEHVSAMAEMFEEVHQELLKEEAEKEENKEDKKED